MPSPATTVFSYLMPLIREHTFSRAAKAGFKVYQEQNVVISANERRDLGKISLTIGAVTEKVSITATSTPIQTSSGENSKLIEAAQLNNITIKGRDLFEILQTIPGVSFGNALLSGTWRRCYQ